MPMVLSEYIPIRDTMSLLTLAAHGDGVRHTDGVELPSDHAFLLERVLDDLAEIKD